MGDWTDLKEGNATLIAAALNATSLEAHEDDGSFGLRIDASPIAGAATGKQSLFLERNNNPLSGSSVLRLATLPTRVKGIHAVTGLLELHTRSTRMQAMGFPSMHGSSHAASVSGIYLQRTGRLSLFANAETESIGLHWGNSNNGSTVNSGSLASDRLRRLASSISSSDALSPSSASSPNKVLANGLLLNRASSGADINRIAAHAARTPSTGGFNCFLRFDLRVRAILSDTAPEQAAGALDRPRPVKILGKGSSESCNASMAVDFDALHIDLPRALSKASVFTLLMTVTSIAQIYLTMHQLTARSNTQAAALKISLLCVGAQAVLDSYLCLVYLSASVVFEALFNAFATVAFFKLLLFAVFEMRLMLVAWKAVRAQEFSAGWQSVRRALSVLYSRFYCALIASIIIMWRFWDYQHALMFIAYSFWVPQIVFNVVNDCHNPFTPKYIYGITLTRLLAPVYMLGCPRNFLTLMFHGKSLYWSSGALYLCVWAAVQVYVLESQQWWGARWFIPRRFLPQKYDYTRKVPSNLRGEDCVICMGSVEECDKSSHMITPCNHLFHGECLLQWMDVKMECPTCRAKIPPP